jgi:hypothetical protein
MLAEVFSLTYMNCVSVFRYLSLQNRPIQILENILLPRDSFIHAFLKEFSVMFKHNGNT